MRLRVKAAGLGLRRGMTLIELMIVVAIIGVLAAVAIPVLIDYVRNSKVTEVHEHLDKCAKGTVKFYQEQRTTGTGAAVTPQLPDEVTPPICPNGVADPAALDDEARFYDQATFPDTFQVIHLEIKDAAYACYGFTHLGANPPAAAGDGFACEAFMDLDDDGVPSKYVRRGRFNPDSWSFQTGAIWHDPASDDW